MDVTLLRTLTIKSTLKYGKYHDLTVQNIFDVESIKGITWLVWTYYNSSKISFNKEVLDLLGITENIQITKPGKVDKETFYLFSTIALGNRTEKESKLPKKEIKKRIGLHKRTTDFKKKTSILKSNAINKMNTKSNLKSKNEGHNITFYK